MTEPLTGALPNPSDMSIAEMLAEARQIIQKLNELNDRMLDVAMGDDDHA